MNMSTPRIRKTIEAREVLIIMPVLWPVTVVLYG